MVFPLYRRTADGRHYYRIEGEDRFSEVQVVGGGRMFHTVHATRYPERLRIMEMIEEGEGRYEAIDEDIWLEQMALVKG